MGFVDLMQLDGSGRDMCFECKDSPHSPSTGKCFYCKGTGINDNDASKAIDSNNLEDLNCEQCKGTGKCCGCGGKKFIF